MKKYKILIILLVLINSYDLESQIKSQTYEILGMDAQTIKRLIEINTYEKNKPDSYGRYSETRVYNDVKYDDGIITEIIQCFENKIFIDLKMSVNYCEHYLVENGKIKKIIKQFENIQTKKLTEIYDKNYQERKIGNKYFEKDYENYLIIYLSKNNKATIEYKKTEIEKITEDERNKIEEMKIKQNELENKNRIEYYKKLEILSKVYDLKEENREIYDLKIKELQKEILQSIEKYKILPSYEELSVTKNEYFKYKNLFEMKFEIDEDRKRKNIIKKIEGDDDDYEYLNDIYINIDNLVKEDYKVKTLMKLEKVEIECEKGISIIKIKRNKIKYYNNITNKEILENIEEKIKEIPDGKYEVKYKLINIIGNKTIEIKIEKKKLIKNKKTFAYYTGLISLLGLIYTIGIIQEAK